MRRLERYQGHFYNWYETRTLRPLRPLYVSSVDSGNLAGHLLTLGSGLREMAGEKMFGPEVFAGLRDTVGILKALLPGHAALGKLEQNLASPPSSLRAAYALLEGTASQAARIAASLANEEKEIKDWAQTLKRNCDGHVADLLFLASWLALPDPQPGRVLPETLAQLDQAPALQSLCPLIEKALLDLETSASEKEEQSCSIELARCLREDLDHARERLVALETLAAQSDEMAAMDFSFLFDAARDLFSIGFNVTDRRRDTSFYDLLASEARLCSYVAIALGQVPQDHWFSMGRLLVAARGGPILVSWSGSMFEYLMPLLVMPNYENTLLDHTCKAVVQQQIDYGNRAECRGAFPNRVTIGPTSN